MIRITSSSPPRSGAQRRLHRALGATVISVGAALLSLTGGGAAIAAPTAPPPVTILTSSPFVGNEDFFISPFGDSSTYENGPEILSPDGSVVWFHPVPAGQEASDFREQNYERQPVLTWWQGTGLGGLAAGTDYIYNEQGQQIAAVNAGNGLSADGHEFLITPWNTALILAYTTGTANLTSIGGPADQTVVNGVVQEIDIATGKVLFQWNSEDHVPYSQSEQPLPASASDPWDWFHINAVKVARDGSLLIDARDTWTTYDVNPFNGSINWQIGGKDSSFKLRAAPGQSLDNAGEIFAWQHDPEDLGKGIYTWFDNEGAPPEYTVSRAVTVKLDFFRHTATLIKSVDQPEGQIAGSQGNAQSTDRRNLVVGWGALPYFSEFAPDGTLLFNARFPTGVNTYRAYQEPFPGYTGPFGL